MSKLKSRETKIFEKEQGAGTRGSLHAIETFARTGNDLFPVSRTKGERLEVGGNITKAFQAFKKR